MRAEMAAPGTTTSFCHGDQRVTVAPWAERVAGVRQEFLDETDARRFLSALPSTVSLRALHALLPAAPSVADDDPRVLAALGHALTSGALRVYRAALPPLSGPGGPGGGGTGPDVPVPPTVPDDAKVDATPAPAPLWVLASRIPDADVAGNAFEGSTLTVTARLVEGAEALTAGSLSVVRHAGGSVATHAFDPSQGTYAWDHVTELLPEGETSRRVRASMTVGADAQQGHEDFTLWPKTLTLKVRHRDTNNPLKGFVFRVLQPGGASVTGTTDATGAVVVTLPKPAPFKVFADPPSEITSWVDAEGRTREAKGVTAFKAVIEKPAKPATGSVIEQFVNLATAADGQDAQGHLVKFEVKGEDPAQAGDPVFVRVRFGRQSRRNSPLPAVTGLTDAFVEADGFMVTGRVTLDANKKASFSVELGIAGGDTCDVAVGGTRAARDETRSLKNWRKVFYQVTRPASMTTPSLALMTASLAKVFIRYEKYKEVTFAEGDAGTPAGSWFDGADFGLSGRVVNIGDHNKAFFHAKFDDSKNPIGVHVLFCHAQFDGGSPAHKTTWTTTITPASAKIPFPGGGSVYGLRKTLNGHVFPKAFQDGNDSVRDVTWQSLAASGPMAGKTGTITSADVHVNWNTANHRVTIRLPADALAVIAAGHSVRVTATALWSNGVFLGEADGTHGNWQLIRNNANDAATQTNAVMAHELGHTLFMVLKVTPPGTDAGAHGYKYERRGHQGPHCGFGVSPALFASGADLGGGGGTCVMFGEAGAASPSSFCVRCAPFVNAQNLSTIV